MFEAYELSVFLILNLQPAGHTRQLEIVTSDSKQIDNSYLKCIQMSQGSYRIHAWPFTFVASTRCPCHVTPVNRNDLFH